LSFYLELEESKDKETEYEEKKELDKKELDKLANALKNSLSAEIHLTVDARKPSTTTGLAEQLKEYHSNIKSSKHLEVYLKCLMGRNLCEIHNSYKSKGRKANFMKFVKSNLTTYSDSEIYFMMKLHKLSEEFPRLMYVTLGTGVLKSKLKWVEQVMREDKVFWDNIPSRPTKVDPASI